MKKQAGMVLLMTLLLTSLSAITMLMMMRAVMSMMQQNTQVIAAHAAFYALEAQARKRINAQRLTRQLECRVFPHDALLTPCHYHDAKLAFDYGVMDEGVFPCLRIQRGRRDYASHHWSVWISSQELSVRTFHWRIARIERRASSCADSMTRVIPDGVLTWHEIE